MAVVVRECRAYRPGMRDADPERPFLERLRTAGAKTAEAGRAADPTGAPTGTPSAHLPWWSPDGPRPRWQTALLGGVGGAAFGFVASAIAGGVYLALRYGPPAFSDVDAMSALAREPIAMAVTVFVAQVGLGVSALVFAAASPVPWRTRLAIVRPAGGFGVVTLIVASTVAIHWVAGMFLFALKSVGWLPPIGEERAAFAEIVSSLPNAWVAPGLLLIGLMPALSEEALFRGFVLTGLLARWPAWAAIGLSAAMFAASHLDFTHAVMMLPMGCWLGYAVWRTRSIVPGMVCHLVINGALFLLVTLVMPGPGGTGPGPPPPAGPAVWLGLLLMAALASPLVLATVRVLERRAHETQPPAA